MGSFRRAGFGSEKLDGSCGATVHRRINRRTRHVLHRHRCFDEGERALHPGRQRQNRARDQAAERSRDYRTLYHRHRACHRADRPGVGLYRRLAVCRAAAVWLAGDLHRCAARGRGLQAGFRNKNDRNDARGIADLMRVYKYRPVWVKSPEAQRQGRLLTARATLQSQLVALENTIRGLLRQEGIGLTDRRTAFEAAVREVIAEDHLLHAAVHPLLETRNAVLCQRAALDRQILLIVRADPVCRLLMTAPGVGALVALTFKVAVDDPGRFSRSRNVGAHFGLTPREHSSGELRYQGRISKMGDHEVRRLLYVAASRMLRRDAALWCPLKAWAVRLAQRVGIRRARVALARKLAVVL